LFDPIAGGIAKPDATAAAKAVRDRLGPQPAQLFESHKPAFRALEEVLSSGSRVQKPLIEGATPAVRKGGKSVELTGPFSPATTFSENLQLEYANGFQGNDLGWGRLTASNLHLIMQLHGVYADLTRRTPYL